MVPSRKVVKDIARWRLDPRFVKHTFPRWPHAGPPARRFAPCSMTIERYLVTRLPEKLVRATNDDSHTSSPSRLRTEVYRVSEGHFRRWWTEKPHTHHFLFPPDVLWLNHRTSGRNKKWCVRGCVSFIAIMCLIRFRIYQFQS